MDLGYIAAMIFGIFFIFSIGIMIGDFISEGREKSETSKR